MGKGWWRPQRVAKYLDCSLHHVYDLVREGELSGCKMGGSLRVSVASLEEWEERHRIVATEKK